MTNDPVDYAIHIIEKKMPVDQLILILYENPTPLVFQHFKTVNQHLANGVVRPGQIVMISPATANTCTVEEAAFQDAARQIDIKLRNMASQEREILASRYELLSNVASYNGLLLGVANTGWQAHTKQVKAILEDIERAYVRTYNTHGKLNKNAFFKFRKMKFTQLNNVLKRFWAPSVGGTLMPGDMRRNLGLSSKRSIHQWNKMGGSATSIPSFAKNYDQIGKMATNLKRVGYLGIALDGVQSVSNIQKACMISAESETCSKTKYTETGRFGGSVGGGIGVGGATSYLTCNLLFGLGSAGSSLLWCSIVAGASGGYFGSKYGGKIGSILGEDVYSFSK